MGGLHEISKSQQNFFAFAFDYLLWYILTEAKSRLLYGICRQSARKLCTSDFPKSIC